MADTSTPDPRGPSLGDTGNVYVTLAAAQSFARHEGTQIEEARKRLTALLVDAHRHGDKRTDTGAEEWRCRSRPISLDIKAHVAREGRLAVVTHVRTGRY